MPRQWLLVDLVVALNSFPARALQDALRGKQAEIADAVAARARSGTEPAPQDVRAAA